MVEAKGISGRINQDQACFADTLFTQPSQSTQNRDFSSAA